MGQFDQALSDATISSSPPLSDGTLQILRGEIYWLRGDYEKAKEKFDRAVDLGVSDVGESALSTRAQFFLSRREYLLAARDAEKGLSLTSADNPHAVYAALIAALAYRGSGQLDKAKAVVGRVLPHTTDEWSKKLLQFADGSLSADQLLAAAQSIDDKTEANTYVAVTCIFEGNEKEARPLLEWVVDHGNKGFTEYPQAKTMLRDLKGLSAETR